MLSVVERFKHRRRVISVCKKHSASRRSYHQCLSINSVLIFLVASSFCGAVAELEASEAQEGDSWDRIMDEDWQPGRVEGSDNNSSNPMKDMECVGPQTAIRSTKSYTWAMVKAHLHENGILEPRDDVWMFNVAAQVQSSEPDNCVLGVTVTSAFLLPVTMPKLRNMARMLSTDQDLMVLNVTFYDTLRSGFPIFGVIDSLSTDEYRAWFDGEEAEKYFGKPVVRKACESSAAEDLMAEVSAARRGEIWQDRTATGAALRWFADGGDAVRGCPLASAAAHLIWASARAETAPAAGAKREAALRDVIDLVSQAEELVRDYSAEDVVQFGQLVATRWNIWWLLHQLQKTFRQRLFHGQAHTMWSWDTTDGRDEL